MHFLHNEQFFAAAQRKYAYIYDKRGIEVHCLKVRQSPIACDLRLAGKTSIVRLQTQWLTLWM